MEVYTYKEAAALLKISTFTLERIIKAGGLAICRIGSRKRISQKALEDYINAQTEQASRGV